MASSITKNHGRLGIILLLLSLLTAALLFIFIAYSCDSQQSATDDQTIVTEAALPQVETLASGAISVPATAPPADPGTPTASTAFASQFSADNPSPLPPATGDIAGTVVNDFIQPLSGIAVYLFRVDGSPAGVSTVTGAGGGFDMALAPGQYKLFFADPTGFYQSAWYGGYGPTTAAVVTVISGRQTTVAQSLSPSVTGGSLAGTVRDKGDRRGLAGVNVFAFLYIDGNCLTGSCDTIELRGTAVTDEDGAYSVNGLDAGSYKVMFNPAGTLYSVQWYREQSIHSTAKTVLVLEGKATTGIDASLYWGSTISGTITKQSGGAAAYALVDVYDETGIIIYSGLTDAAGHYRTSRLPDGYYRVHAATNIPGGWTEEWYNDKADFASADPVLVNRSGDITGIDIEIGDQPPANPGTPGDEVIIFEESGVVADVPQDTREAGPLPAGDNPSDDGLPFGQRADQMVLPDKNQQDVVSDGSDDQAVVGQVERDDPPLA